MKTIVLKRFTVENGNYRVYLGNNRSLVFTSKRDLIAFILETNRFLSQKSFEIHAAYTDVWQEYQRCWFYFGYGDQNYSLPYIDQARCSELLKDCEERLSDMERRITDYGKQIPSLQITTQLKHHG